MAMHRRGVLSGLGAAAAVLLAAPAPVAAQLSERLVRTIAQAQNSDLHRRFGRMLIDEGRELEIDPAAGPDEARKTLLRRAALYEKFRDFVRAEIDLTSAAQIDPPSAELQAARGYFYMRRSRFSEALGDFLVGVEIAPGNARV